MKHPYLNLFKTIWEFARGMRAKFIVTYAMFVVANLIVMLEPYFLGKFFDVIQQGGDDLIVKSAFYLGMCFFGCSFLFWLLHGPGRIMERGMAFNITKNFLDNMFRIITKLPLKWHKDNHSGTTIDKVNKASQALREFLDEAYVYIESLIPLIASTIAVFLIAGKTGFFLLILAVVIFFIIFQFDKFLIWSLKKINKMEHKVASVFYDYVSNITTVITLRLEKLAKNEYLKRIRTIFPLFHKRVAMNEIKWFVVDMVMLIAVFFILMYYVYHNYMTSGVIMIGTLVMLQGYMDKFVDVFYGIAWKYERFVMTCTNLSAVEGIIDSYDQLYLRKKFVRSINKKWKNIEIRGLYFKYEDEQHHVHTLEDVNIDLKRGQRVAFVGESGSGKSTMMSILRGLSDADKLEMRVDGRRMNDLRVLADATTLIPQDSEIFENTIEYNITMGISHKPEDLRKACRLACFDKVVKKLPNGFETDIREKGVNLSGGEKQRLALARGVFASKDSSLILLDEPTSSVDSTNEMKIYRNLFKFFKGRCVVSSVHRLHLLKRFDMIYVFDKGRIVEKGSFEELMASDGCLKRQFEGV